MKTLELIRNSFADEMKGRAKYALVIREFDGIETHYYTIAPDLKESVAHELAQIDNGPGWLYGNPAENRFKEKEKIA